MKKPLYTALLLIILSLCNSCKTLQYVPVETVKTELRSANVRDSIFRYDSIRIPYPVEIIKEVKKPLTGWQNFQQWTGRIALVIALLLILYFALKLKKK